MINPADAAVAKAIQRFKEIVDKQLKNPEYCDLEEDHIEADDLLCEVLSQLGHGELVRFYNLVDKWYA